jgi:2-keto-4-pentenoate hydratase/2-oxohepta-3-ene-1,7-dioic acid hydratase in catechol pathway
MKKGLIATGLVTLAGLGLLVGYLFRPLAHKPVPAGFTCLDLEAGTFGPLPALSGRVYGVGLSYAGHIEETASEFTPGAAPPLFIKAARSIRIGGGEVAVPNSAQILAALDSLEPGLEAEITSRHERMPAMLDYEVELALVLLEDIEREALEQETFAPQLGFTVINDLSARSLILLGEGRENRFDYWGLSKSFDGFSALGERMWTPSAHTADAIPCVTLQTTVNGELRQRRSTADMIYTPAQMLRFIAEAYPQARLKRGDVIATGTPGGVVMSTPRHLVRAANLLGFDRFTKLSMVIDREGFLGPGDVVVTTAEGLGSVTVKLTASD